MSKIDHVVFALRNAPPWKELDACYEKEGKVVSNLYLPQITVPHFPNNIAHCVDAWNKSYAINYFKVRSMLAEIAASTRNENEGSMTIRVEELENYLKNLTPKTRAAIFFTDDDDWFHPKVLEIINSLNWENEKINVFPLIRFDTDVSTFVREGESCETLVGFQKKCHFRFQTNNYSVPNTPYFSSILPELFDHITASSTAEKLGVNDQWHDVILSATNKSPCSATILPGILKNKDEFSDVVRRYVETIRNIHLPDKASWCGGYLEEAALLFEEVLR
jgi:hypothetical protein